MALTPQTPASPTTTADSYQSLTDMRDRAVLLGVTLPTDDAELEARTRVAMSYVDGKHYLGEHIVAFQSTAWPRSGIYALIGGEYVEYPNDQIPQEVYDAVIIVAGTESVFSTVEGGRRVQSERVDVIEATYFDDGAASMGFKRVVRADKLLSKYTSRMNSLVIGGAI